MSERRFPRRVRLRFGRTRADRVRRDRGVTLPELLIAISVTGLLVSSMAAASRALVGQLDNTSGRLNNARSEQNIGIWMPADLASAEEVTDEASASPCGEQCPPGIDVSGSNALMLTWHSFVPGDTTATPTTTRVSYRYVEGAVAGQYDIIRVQCDQVGTAAPSCTQVTLLHDVLAPPAGVEYFPGVTKPTWVLQVSLALDPTAPGDGTDPLAGDPTYYVKNGRRITVTINGGGDVGGGGGGEDRITFSAGGVNRETNLSTTNLSTAPTFAATRSRCGGNFGLLVDTSGSIGSNISYVRSGLTAFLDAFAGTPIKLQVVSFASTANTLGAGSNWTKYYDMLNEADVTALKALVNGLSSGGYTNWEDAFFRMFRNSDGSPQQVLPDTLIFFTDGMPTYNRLTATSAAAIATMNTDDSGLPLAGTSGNYNQMSWNRSNRIARAYEADLERMIGVYVGTDVNGTSTWIDQGPGYHLTNFQRGYHTEPQQGYSVSGAQRGSHTEYEYAASGLTYQYAASGLTYQAATSGLAYEYASTGMVFERKVSGVWSAVSASTYFTNNTNSGTSDNYRTRITGTFGGWTSINATFATAYDDYLQSNTVAGESDGFRTRATGTLGSWSNVTKTYFDLSNVSNDSNDGYRVVVGTLGSWTTTTRSYYELNNATSGTTDGYRVTVSGTLGSWTATTEALYLASNSTSDATDGFRTVTVYAEPFTNWESVSDATFAAGNTTDDDTDGWRATVTFASPYEFWRGTGQAVYDSYNVSPDESDGWRIGNAYTAPYTLWEPTSEVLYTSNNTSWGTADGWTATKVYEEPHTFHESYSAYSKTNTAILKQIIAPAGVVPAVPAGTGYSNAAEATYYELPQWTQFSGAMTSMALAECGGTVTLQTKVGSATAADPFTYLNSVDLTTATTSATYRSGTFDYDLAGGGSVQATITPVITTDLSDYSPVGWTCKAAGVDYPFTTNAIEGGPWTSISLTVSPNQAISCTLQVVVS